jgi:hypothetical protein
MSKRLASSTVLLRTRGLLSRLHHTTNCMRARLLNHYKTVTGSIQQHAPVQCVGMGYALPSACSRRLGRGAQERGSENDLAGSASLCSLPGGAGLLVYVLDQVFSGTSQTVSGAAASQAGS